MNFMDGFSARSILGFILYYSWGEGGGWDRRMLLLGSGLLVLGT
jgi:hypothetical protein